jgi:hypothetical protein
MSCTSRRRSTIRTRMDSAPEKRCLNCRYILEHLPEPRCPECGQAFDPSNPDTYWSLEYRAARPWRALAWTLVAIVAAFGFFGIKALPIPTELGAFGLLAIGGLVFARSLLALISRSTPRPRSVWLLPLLVSGLQFFGCGAIWWVLGPLREISAP